MTKIKIAGLDGSLRNFGISIMELDLETMTLSVQDLILAETEKSKNKQVRASSDNLTRAQSIHAKIKEALKSCTAAFVEVPYGGQSYDAVLGFGIVIGLYASIDCPVIEVSPSETKMAAVGTKTASKEEIIEWAAEKFPDAKWLRYKRNGKNYKKGELTSKNEHLADGIAIAHAGLEVPAFKQTIAILKAASAA